MTHHLPGGADRPTDLRVSAAPGWASRAGTVNSRVVTVSPVWESRDVVSRAANPGGSGAGRTSPG